jgi:hypothetical protein
VYQPLVKRKVLTMKQYIFTAYNDAGPTFKYLIKCEYVDEGRSSSELKDYAVAQCLAYYHSKYVAQIYRAFANSGADEAPLLRDERELYEKFISEDSGEYRDMFIDDLTNQAGLDYCRLSETYAKNFGIRVALDLFFLLHQNWYEIIELPDNLDLSDAGYQILFR